MDLSSGPSPSLSSHPHLFLSLLSLPSPQLSIMPGVSRSLQQQTWSSLLLGCIHVCYTAIGKEYAAFKVKLVMKHSLATMPNVVLLYLKCCIGISQICHFEERKRLMLPRHPWHQVSTVWRRPMLFFFCNCLNCGAPSSLRREAVFWLAVELAYKAGSDCLQRFSE